MNAMQRKRDGDTMLDVCLLGCGGMLPLPKRYLTSMILRNQGSNILVDCGEGNQVALYQSAFSLKHIDHMVITHFHGDHVAGIPGLLMTIGNNMRTEPLHIWGGEGLRTILEGLMVICPQLPFDVYLHELPFTERSQFQLGDLTVTALPVEHRVPCLAYSFQLPRQGKFDTVRAQALGIPMKQWGVLQRGQAVEHDGRLIQPAEVLGPARRGLKITYATDCRPSAALAELAQGSDLFIAEGLYGDPEKQSSAAEKGHMVFSEAAQLARQAEVKELWLTHYSPAMTNPAEFLQVAADIFPNTLCGDNLLAKTLRFAD